MFSCGKVWKPVVCWISQITVLSFKHTIPIFYGFHSEKCNRFYNVIFSHQKIKHYFHFLSQLQVFPTLPFTLSLVNWQATLFVPKNFLFTPLLLRTWVTECLTARIRPIKTLFFRDVQSTSRSSSHSRKPVPFNFDYKNLCP
jgi:hypothetical protein